MRYAAIIRTEFESRSQLVGVGESRDDALAAARAWFQTQFDRTSHKDWPRLIALQDQLAVFDEAALKMTTGISLDEWLTRMSALGVAPATAPTTKPETDEEPLVPFPRRRADDSARALVTYALVAIAIIGVLTTAKYAGSRILQRELNEIATQNTFDVGGPVYPPVYATFNPDAWGITYNPSFSGSGGATISGIGSP